MSRAQNWWTFHPLGILAAVPGFRHEHGHGPALRGRRAVSDRARLHEQHNSVVGVSVDALHCVVLGGALCMVAIGAVHLALAQYPGAAEVGSSTAAARWSPSRGS
jgi:hypothetical protein